MFEIIEKEEESGTIIKECSVSGVRVAMPLST